MAAITSSRLYRVILAYFTFFMVTKNLVMYFNVFKKKKLFFFKNSKIQNAPPFYNLEFRENEWVIKEKL